MHRAAKLICGDTSELRGITGHGPEGRVTGNNPQPREGRISDCWSQTPFQHPPPEP